MCTHIQECIIQISTTLYQSFVFVITAINKSTIIRNGLLKPLINLLTVTSLDVQCNACGCITTLATTGSVCVCVCVCVRACVRACVRVVLQFTLFYLYLQLLILFLTDCAESNKVEIVRQGAAVPLIQLARQTNPRAQRNASGSLLNLTHVGEFLHSSVHWFGFV